MISSYDDIIGPASISVPLSSPPGNTDLTTTKQDGLLLGANHFVVYPGNPYSPSYNHGGYLTDPTNSWNAHTIFVTTQSFKSWADSKRRQYNRNLQITRSEIDTL